MPIILSSAIPERNQLSVSLDPTLRALGRNNVQVKERSSANGKLGGLFLVKLHNFGEALLAL